MSRFDNIVYDDDSKFIQEQFKELYMQLEFFIDDLDEGRAKSLALTKLEESYMWVGKAIRDEQIKRGGTGL